MSRPRLILPGTTYMVQRRCTQRQFLLLPDPTVNQVFLYCLAHAAARTGVLVHCICVLSNHYHLVLTDPATELPRFMRYLDQLVARALNVYREHRENFWAPASYSAVRLESPETQLEKMVYSLANPVAAGLVEFGSEWPGLRTRPEEIGGPALLVERPSFFFGPRMPERIALRLEPPPGFEDMDPEDFCQLLHNAVNAAEREHRDEFRAKNRRVLGVEAVRAQSPGASPATPREEIGALNPSVASRDRWRRVERLQAYVAFLVDYARALVRYCRGEHEVVFPAGTYWMRVHFGVNCEAHEAPT